MKQFAILVGSILFVAGCAHQGNSMRHESGSGTSTDPSMGINSGTPPAARGDLFHRESMTPGVNTMNDPSFTGIPQVRSFDQRLYTKNSDTERLTPGATPFSTEEARERSQHMEHQGRYSNNSQRVGNWLDGTASNGHSETHAQGTIGTAQSGSGVDFDPTGTSSLSASVDSVGGPGSLQTGNANSDVPVTSNSNLDDIKDSGTSSTEQGTGYNGQSTVSGTSNLSSIRSTEDQPNVSASASGNLNSNNNNNTHTEVLGGGSSSQSSSAALSSSGSSSATDSNSELGLGRPAGSVSGQGSSSDNEASGNAAANTSGSNSSENSNSLSNSSSSTGIESASDREMSSMLMRQLQSGPQTSDNFSTETLRNLKITSHDGVVTLKGSVASEMEKRNIEERIRQMEGVKSINNQLTVSPASGVEQRNSEALDRGSITE